MKSAIIPVFMASALAVATLAVHAAQGVVGRPNTVKIIVDGQKITAEPEKVWARAGGSVTFVIENHDTVAHEVSIPITKFVPSPKFGRTATEDPLAAGQVDKVTVGSRKMVEMKLHVKPKEHFRFGRLIGMTYKYDVYTRPANGKAIPPLDPDIEIRP